MNLQLSTSRLNIAPLSYGDIAFIRELTNSPGWLKFIGDRNIRSDQDAIKYLETGPFSSYQIHGFGLYKVIDKSTNKPIGMCGFLKRDILPFPDLGFAFLPEFEGKGYAFESANAVLEWVKINMKEKHILAITSTENSRSIALLEKLGFKKSSPIIMNQEELFQFLFSF